MSRSPPARLLARRPARGAGGLHGRHVVGPPRPGRSARESGFAWSFLGAALATTDLPFGVVTAPGQRYHPAITAQAIATLSSMFPRPLLGGPRVGGGEQRAVTGAVWPRKDVRDARLLECVDVIRRILAGEEVDHDGLVTVNRGRLWTLPDAVLPLIGPAVTPATAARHAAWADGLVTVNQPLDTLARSRRLPRRGRRGPPASSAPVLGPTDDEALAIAHDQWRSNVHGPPVSWDTETVEAFDTMARTVTPRRSPRSSRSRVTRPGTPPGSPGVRRPGLGGAYLHSSARSRPPSSTPSASTCCPSSAAAPPGHDRSPGRRREEATR